MKELTITILLAFITLSTIVSQSVGIAEGEITPHSSAALEIRSSSKGLLIPRLTNIERKAIENPAVGLIIFQTNNNSGFYYFDGDLWYHLNDSGNDYDADSTNELQNLSINGNIISLSNGGSVKLPVNAEDKDKQTLSIQGDTLSIQNGNYVLLRSVKDNLGTHSATKNIKTNGYYISYDGDNEGVLVNPDGDVTIGLLNITGTTTTSNLNATGSVNLGSNAIQTEEIGNSAITTNKIANSQITGNKLHPMGAGIDQYLKFNGNEWVPADMPGGLNYLGTWDASKNAPFITNSIGQNSEYYVVSIAGSQNLGSGVIPFSIGDWVIHNGTAWEKINNSSDVNSVFGRTGTILSQYGDYTWELIDKTSSDIGDIANVNTTVPVTGQILIHDGSLWINKTISGDISLNSSGNTQIKPGVVRYSNLVNASGGNNTVLFWNGSAWGESSLNALEGDGSSTNEIQRLTLTGNTLQIESGNSVNLSGYLDNTDNQDLSLSGNTLSLTNDASTVNLSAYLDNTDAQNLSFTSPNLTISGGNTVDLSALSAAGSDNQTINLSGNTLAIEDGNSVDLSGFMDNTDNQDLSLSENTLSLTNDASAVNLSAYLDNTDAQTLSFTSPNLTISGGNTVDLSTLSAAGSDNQTINLSGNTLAIEDGNSVDLSGFMDNTDAQTLSFTSPNLSIEGGNSVDLSALSAAGSDNQTISLTGNSLTIEDGNSVDLSGFMDNTDKQTLNLNGNLLEIENGNNVNLSVYLDNTDNQNLTGASLSGTTLQIDIEDGTSASVDLAALQDGNKDDDADSTNERITNAALNGNTLEITEAGTLWSVDLSPLSTPSDRRLKENIVSTGFSLDDVLSLNVVDYDFKSGTSGQTGFIAQELYRVYPTAVHVGGEDASANPWGVNYGMLTPLLTKAIQDLHFRLKVLERLNSELSEKNKKIQIELSDKKAQEERIKILEEKVERLLNEK